MEGTVSCQILPSPANRKKRRWVPRREAWASLLLILLPLWTSPTLGFGFCFGSGTIINVRLDLGLLLFPESCPPDNITEPQPTEDSQKGSQAISRGCGERESRTPWDHWQQRIAGDVRWIYDWSKNLELCLLPGRTHSRKHGRKKPS